MRYAIVYTEKSSALKSLSESIADEARKNNHTVELYGSKIDKDVISLRTFNKVIIGSHSLGFWKKNIPRDLRTTLKKCQGLLGKKTIVFLKPGLIRKNLALRTLMDYIESESGAFIENFAIIKSRKKAEEFGRSL